MAMERKKEFIFPQNSSRKISTRLTWKYIGFFLETWTAQIEIL